MPPLERGGNPVYLPFPTHRRSEPWYVATVEMNRPPVNAQSAALRAALTWVFDTISDRDDVGASARW